MGGEPVQEVAAIPQPNEVGGEPTQEVATSPQPGEVGSEPAPKVIATADIEEEEVENRDTYFKRKRKLPPPVASP